MSDLFPPINPISPIEPIRPVTGLRDTDPRIYQIYAMLFQSLEELRLPEKLPETIVIPPLPERPFSTLKRRRIAQKKKKEVKKIESIIQTLLFP